MDNSGFVTLTSNYQPGDVFPIGKTEVVYSAIDPSGNSATASFVVTVAGRHKRYVLLPIYTLICVNKSNRKLPCSATPIFNMRAKMFCRIIFVRVSLNAASCTICNYVTFEIVKSFGSFRK